MALNPSLPTVREQELYPLPHTGEAVDLSNPDEVATALKALRDFQREGLRDAIATLEHALVLESERQGTKTLRFDGVQATVSQDVDTVYDVEKLRKSLTNAGCPEDRLNELIQETVTYKVNGTVARQLAGSNPKYERAIKRNRERIAGRMRVGIK